MNKNKIIGKTIKYIRQNKGFTQEELSKKLFIGRTTLSDYEREKTDINFEIINKICEICDFEIIFKNKITNEEITSENIDRKL